MRKFYHFEKFIKKIIVMSAAGCLLIFCTERYYPEAFASVSGLAQGELKPVSELSSETSVSFVSQVTKKWDNYLDSLSQKIESLTTQKQGEDIELTFLPSVLQYNLVYLYPDEEEAASEIDENNSLEKTFSYLLNHPSELADTILTPLYQKLNMPVKSKVADSFGGQMYEFLNQKDAQWASNLYQWVQATPAKAAVMKSIAVSSVTGGFNPNNPLHKAEEPSTWLIPSWKEVTIKFYNGDGNETELYSNTQEILSLASVNTFFTNWQDVNHFKSYAASLWDISHDYSTKISEVYFCEGCESLNPLVTKEEMTEAEGDLMTAEALSPAASIDSAAAVPSKESIGPGNIGETDMRAASESAALSASPPESLEESQAALPEQGESVSTNETAGQSVEAAVNSLETQVNSLESQVNSFEPQVNSLEPQVNSLEPQVDSLDTQENGDTLLEMSKEKSEAINSQPPEIKLNTNGKFCPGHVDLTITAQITGLTEKNDLFAKDKIAFHPWSPYMKSYVYELFNKDWGDEYGLSPMELGMGKPLTASEIADYLSLLPMGISPERRAVVTYALNSVGKIPYYYGGKPAAVGYENNGFSTPIKPDHNGRVLSGLDCSGWVNWVYWSSIGKRLNALGTSGLISEGRAVSPGELKPGDILVKPGLNSHVVMFLAWTSDNRIICIHETGGTVSNVTVSTLGSSWPYYRAILD